MTFGETFLESPDLFPARPGGEPWGDTALRLDLACGPYRLEGLTGGQESVLRERFGERVLGPAEPSFEGDEDVAVQIFRAAKSDFLDFDRVGKEITVDRSYEPRAVGLAGWRFMGRLDWRPELCAALWTSLSEGPELQGVFENFLRVLVAYRLLERGGVLIHSAGVVESGAVHLFLGPSGAGKTTMGRLALAAGREVLSDDMNAVAVNAVALNAESVQARDTERHGGFRVERLPFAGDLGQTAAQGESLPLAGLHRLEQGPAIRTAPLSPARSLAALLACCPFVNADPHRREALERNLERVLEAVRLDRLTFPREGPFEDIADHLGGALGAEPVPAPAEDGGAGGAGTAGGDA